MDKPVVLITGSSSGFGYLSAITLAKAGYHVLATMRNMEKSTLLKERIQEEQLANVEILQLDVTKHDEAKETIDEAVRRLGRIDVLINNAGYAKGGFAEEVAIEQYRSQLETNFFGLVAITKAVLPYMRAQRNGKIINISSVSGRSGFPLLSPYAASKFAVEGFSESLRLEMLPFGVFVSLIEPGAYETSIWSVADVSDSKSSPYQSMMETVRYQLDRIIARAGNPQEVVDLILRVVKEKAPRLRYPIGEGMRMQLFLKNLLPWKWIEKQIIKRLS